MELYDRQGADITAADMVQPEEQSEIVQFYNNSVVFITGATGFLGKLAMEKLLRVCPDINKIYILIRQKKGKDVKQRFEEIFSEPSFDVLKRKYPNFHEKVHAVKGDISLPGLGLSDEDRATLIKEVDCIFHYAATVRFDEKIRLATFINIRAVRDCLLMAKEMKQLRAFMYVSTAYSNCVRKDIDEAFYDPPIDYEKLITLVDCLDEDTLNKITPTLLGDYPNTYAFTKCIAEDVIRKEGRLLPVACYRPSIVIGTVKEPVAGWIDSVYGATGVLLGAASGLIRVLHGYVKNRADMVPADYVVNSCFAAAWEVATYKSLNDNKEKQEDEESIDNKYEKEVPVYNFVSSMDNPLTWETFEGYTFKHCSRIPSDKIVWHYVFYMIRNKHLAQIMTFLLHTIPAYIVDFLAVCLGKKPLLVKGYKKIDKFCVVLAYFTSREWNWKNNNMNSVWARMKRYDRELFDFDIKNLNWDNYFFTYSRGARVYIFKDPMHTVPEGKVKYYKVMVAHYILCTVLLFLFYKFCMFSYRSMFGF